MIESVIIGLSCAVLLKIIFDEWNDRDYLNWERQRNRNLFDVKEVT